jgi:hypothetical protein
MRRVRRADGSDKRRHIAHADAPSYQRPVRHRTDGMHRNRHETAPLQVVAELSSERISPWRYRLAPRLRKKSLLTATTP